MGNLLNNISQEAPENDPVSQQEVGLYCQQGWPTKNSVKLEFASYWNNKEFLMECKVLLMYGHRIVVPIKKNLEENPQKTLRVLSGKNNIIGMVARYE